MDNMHVPPPMASASDSEVKGLDEVLNLVPRGFKFYPGDVELIEYYLKAKISGDFIIPGRIYDVDVYKHSPEHLNDKYKREGEQHIYFFTPRNRKYPNGGRPDRAVEGFGFWKATGRDNPINKNTTVIGFKRTLVFYKGRPKDNVKTNWIMQEFTLKKEKNLASSNITPPCQMQLDDWVLCKIYKIKRERESDDNEEVTNCKRRKPNAKEVTIAMEDVNTLPQPSNQHLQIPLQVVNVAQYPPHQHSHGQDLQVPLPSSSPVFESGINSFLPPPAIEDVNTDLRQPLNQHLQIPLQDVNTTLWCPPNQDSYGQHLQVPLPSSTFFESSASLDSFLPPRSSPLSHLDKEFDTNIEGWAWWS